MRFTTLVVLPAAALAASITFNGVRDTACQRWDGSYATVTAAQLKKIIVDSYPSAKLEGDSDRAWGSPYYEKICPPNSDNKYAWVRRSVFFSSFQYLLLVNVLLLLLLLWLTKLYQYRSRSRSGLRALPPRWHRRVVCWLSSTTRKPIRTTFVGIWRRFNITSHMLGSAMTREGKGVVREHAVFYHC